MSSSPLSPPVDFHALTLKDLLAAREAYHVHLSQIDNVVATAVGRYRIRRSDLEKDRDWAIRGRYPGKKDPFARPLARTLQNSVVIADSWPCLLVFVRRWQQIDAMEGDPERVVPKRLYLPDGRMVPVCIVLAPIDEGAPPPLMDLRPGGDLLGGGQPVFSEVQGETQVGSVGCLVSDGSRLYALTNRHVSGEAGRTIYSLSRGERMVVGRTHALQLGKLPFEEVYPAWAGSRSVSHLDAGLIEIADRGDWTAQVYGIGEIGEPIDLNVDTLSLELIGSRVKAFGGVSGALSGEICALFYRCRSIGGVDFIADLLIGPRDADSILRTRPGDSGTLWFHEPSEKEAAPRETGARARRLRPLAIEWGGQRFLGSQGEESLQFALATCLSTVLRRLDVELVRSWNIGFSEYWGKVGHYKVGAKACELPTNANLRKLMLANQALVAFDDDAIGRGDLQRIKPGSFVPLADVADLVWRTTRKADASNHFADMDQKGRGPFAGKTLLALCADPANVDVKLWNRFYESLGEAKRGALPFRVWQIYDAMVDALGGATPDVERFVCAAGILAHYVGDACQPLHVSHLHHGRDEGESRVHADYETAMLDRNAVEFAALVNAEVKTQKGKLPTFKGGKNAALASIGLMRRTVKRLPPERVVEIWAANPGRGRVATLWDKTKAKTAACVADGSRTLATIWQSAWVEGGGSAVKAARLVEQDRARLKKLYDDKGFLPALSLKKMEEQGLP